MDLKVSPCPEARPVITMRKVKACIGLIFILVVVRNASASPIQYLPEVPGYIPVYIRYGDQPLEDINPKLAEAFHESTVISKSIGENTLDGSTASENAKNNLIQKEDATRVIPLKQLISALSEDQKELKSQTNESEAIVEKLNEYLPLENIEVKIIVDHQVQR